MRKKSVTIQNIRICQENKFIYLDIYIFFLLLSVNPFILSKTRTISACDQLLTLHDSDIQL